MKTSNVEPNEDTEKKCTLFDMISIAESIKTPWKDLTEDQQKLWNPYIINRFISSRNEYAPLIALLSKYNLTPEQHYTFICSIIDGSRKHYFNYQAYKKDKISEDDKLLVWACSKEYEIGFREAKMYLADMKQDVKDKLKEKWKDSYDFEQRL